MTIPGIINRSSITQRTNMTKMKLMNLNCIRLVKNKDFRGQLGGCCFHIPKPRLACAFVLKNHLRFSKLLPLRFAALMDLDCGLLKNPRNRRRGSAVVGAAERVGAPAFLELMSSLLPLDACAAFLRICLQES